MRSDRSRKGSSQPTSRPKVVVLEDVDGTLRRFEYSSFVVDVPFEFVGEIASPCAVTEASHVECSTSSSRHVAFVRGCRGVLNANDIELDDAMRDTVVLASSVRRA